MRIGIDATCWANQRGYGRYTRGLVTAMWRLAPGHEYVCLLDAQARATFGDPPPQVTPVVVDQRVSPTEAAAAGGHRSGLDLLRLSRAAWQARTDVFYLPSVYTYFPLPPGLPAVVTVHDAIAERYPDLTLPSARDRLFWRLKTSMALRQAQLVLTVSDFSAREISEHFGLSPSRIRVTWEGVADAYAPSESADDVRRACDQVGIPPDGRWLIYVGGFNPHKRVDVLVRAHAAMVRRHPDTPLFLVLAGPIKEAFHSDLDSIRSVIAASGTEPFVRWAGYLPDEQLRHLHSGAVALVLVSMQEGFGLPAVEAARCGTPVIATTESPLPHLLEGGGLFVPPGDQAALESAIERMLMAEGERRAMGCRARERAMTLSWDRSAAVVLEALEEAARMRGGIRGPKRTGT